MIQIIALSWQYAHTCGIIIAVITDVIPTLLLTKSEVIHTPLGDFFFFFFLFSSSSFFFFFQSLTFFFFFLFFFDQTKQT